MQHIAFEKISLKRSSEFNESWVQDIIAKNPNLLGLGELVLRHKEKRQPRAGRIDSLFEDPEQTTRYEVEIQLGPLDESHIIRTIEYWDIERKRHPKYDHVAVIIAEDITSRFLNVVSLFNGMIPLIAIQMKLLKHENVVSLDFTTVLNLFATDSEEAEYEQTDRTYWENKASKQTLAQTDEVFSLLKEIDPELEPKYNKFYIGVGKRGIANNFVIMRPKKNFLKLEPRLEFTLETTEKIENSNLESLDYDARWGRYRIRLKDKDIKNHHNFIKEIVSQAYDNENKQYA